MKASTTVNGRPVGLLRGAGTRMAYWFYAMHRALRLQDVLLSTIHSPAFSTLDIVKTDDRVRLAVTDMKDPIFWKALYTLLRSGECYVLNLQQLHLHIASHLPSRCLPAVYPALRALRLCDSNTPGMDKIYYLTYRVTRALQNLLEKLNDDDELFPEPGDDVDDGVALEREQVFGSSNTVDEEEDESEPQSESDDE